MSKWLRRGFGGGGGGSTPTSGLGGPTAVCITSNNAGRQDSAMNTAYPMPLTGDGGGATTTAAAPMPQAAYYYDPSTQNGPSAAAAAASAATKSRSNRTSGSSQGQPQGQGPPTPITTAGVPGEESIHVHPPKVSRHVRTPSDPSRAVAWGMTPQQQGRMMGGGTPRDAAPPSYNNAHNTTNELAQPPPPGTTPTSINANHNNYNHSTNYNSNNTSSVYPPPNNNNDSIVDYSSSQLSNPQGGSMPRRPAYLLHRDLIIGKGSYGQVCIASRGEAEGGRSGKRKKFACKCVMLRSDPKYIAKLQEEVNVLRELRGHENVIRLYDVFCVENELFIITELGRGGDLFHLLTTHPKHGVTESYAGTEFTNNHNMPTHLLYA